MITKSTARVLFMSCASLVLTGCMPKMTVEEMKSMMPQRPAELDVLDAFAGKWEMEGEARMAMLDEPIKTSGTSDMKWEGNGWYLVGRASFTMEGLDDMTGLEAWTYDTHSKKYRSTWIDSMGSIGVGTAKYDDETRTWHMRAKSHSPFGKSKMKGTARLIDDDTIEWSMTEYAMGGLMKTMEWSGTSRRR